jgi:two-component system response regulator HydG
MPLETRAKILRVLQERELERVGGNRTLKVDVRVLAAAAARLKRAPKALAADAYRALCAHEWKGNVRELEHALEQAVALASGPEIALGDLPASVRDLSADGGSDPPGSFREAKQRAVERFERQFIHEALVRHHGKERGARALPRRMVDQCIAASSSSGAVRVT